MSNTTNRATPSTELDADAVEVPFDLHIVRQRKIEATAHLLGDTIRLSDAEWQQPSLLPGWSRAHVATHISRNADGLRRSVEGFVSGRVARMYPSEEERQDDIERGSQRTGLDLQIDLDTSASQFNTAMNALEALDHGRWHELVELRAGFRVPAGLVPTARLAEVVLHRIDLGLGYTVDDVEDDISSWLLQWIVFKLGDRGDIPRLELHASSGFTATVGGSGEQLSVTGDDQQLMGWLSGRGNADKLTGTENTVLPLIG